MRSLFVMLFGVLAVMAWTSGAAAQNQTHTATDHHEADADAHHHEEAPTLANPVKATPESLAAGKKLYDTQCATCHGESGKGDGKMAASMKEPKPADLTDASWKHGATDGAIFTLVRDGSKGTGMRGYASRMKTEDIWNVVNYLRTLGPTPPKPH